MLKPIKLAQKNFLSSLDTTTEEFHQILDLAINLKHKNASILGFKKHHEVINIFKRTSITVAPSRWEEPFGRTSLEASANGCAVIITNKGGLPETVTNARILPKLNVKELEKIFKFFGEEKDAKKIAKIIVRERKTKKIDTQILVALIEKIKKKKNFKIHNATKVFQALRIFVNKEISELIFGLITASKILKKNGVLAVVTFHSIEDKIVKYFFKSLSEKKSVSRYLPKLEQSEKLFYLKEKKPILPSIKELKENISSRSAKLRYLIKKDNSYHFENDILDKFEHLLKIESIGDKL